MVLGTFTVAQTHCRNICVPDHFWVMVGAFLHHVRTMDKRYKVHPIVGMCMCENSTYSLVCFGLLEFMVKVAWHYIEYLLCDGTHLLCSQLLQSVQS